MHVNIRKQDGFTLIDILFVCGLIGVLSIIALPRLLLARQAAGSASAIGSLRAINSAQLTFALTCGAGFYSPNLSRLGVAPPGSREAFISPNLSVADTVTRSGYVIQLEGTPFPGAPASCNGLAMGEGAQAFKAGADPNEIENVRFFATNADGQLYEDRASMYAAMPEMGEPATGHVLY
jgi:type II secretory pathway pseudopilin PulG